MYFWQSIFLCFLMNLSFNTKTSQVFGIIGDEVKQHRNMECALAIKHNNKFICSGSLVLDGGIQFVITSAKCLWNGGSTATSHWPAGHIEVFGWTPNLVTIEGYRKEVRKIVIHPGFDPRYLNHDIAVIFLYYAFPQFGDEVKNPEFLACEMPKPGNKITGGLVMMGFGTQSLEYPTDGQLRKVVVPYVNHKTCENFGHDLNKGLFCVGFLGKGGVGPCIGDEGGPVLGRIGLKRRFYLAGIYSHTPAYANKVRVNCVDHRVPAFATDIEQHLDWIREEIKNRGVPDN